MTWFRFNGSFSAPDIGSTPARRGDTITGPTFTQDHDSPSPLPLAFEGTLIIVGGGTVEPDLLRTLAKNAAGLIGADSGGDTILAAGLVPDAVIGDMDSVADPSRFPKETRIVAISEQDSTDFGKCLYSTRAPLTLGLGMTGGRFDHTLAALNAVAKTAHARKIILVDTHDLALGVLGSIRVAVGKGARVSIYPLGRTAFSGSQGLLYPLDGLVMEQDGRIGTSNAATEDIVSITVAEGEQSPWLLILDRTLLAAVS